MQFSYFVLTENQVSDFLMRKLLTRPIAEVLATMQESVSRISRNNAKLIMKGCLTSLDLDGYN